MAQQILIDKLLMACVKQGASDIHITVGQPPVFRLHGRLRRLETKVLESEDTLALMKSISPERCQRELQEAGTSDFGFAFGDKARFRVSIFKQRGDVAMVLRQIPTSTCPRNYSGWGRWSRSSSCVPRVVPVTGPPVRARVRRWPAWSISSTKTSTITSSRLKTRSSSIITTRNRPSTSANWRGRAQFRGGHPSRFATGPGRDPGRRNA